MVINCLCLKELISFNLQSPHNFLLVIRAVCLAQLVTSLPSNHKVPSSIPGSADI